MSHGKTVLVTGASSGIGQACALRLDRAGYHVFATALSAEEGAQTQSLASPRLQMIGLDITDAESIAHAVATITEAVGEKGLHALVNNAGILGCAPLELVNMTMVRRVFEVNVFGQIDLTQALLPLLRTGQGRVINIGSLAGRSALPFTSPYNASKFALRALNDTWRLELRGQGIAVSLIEPGMVVTPIWEKSHDETNTLTQELPPEVLQRHAHFVAKSRQAGEMAHKNGVSTAQVAEVVLRALQAKRPKAHYQVGRESRLLLGLERLPTRWRDWLVGRYFSI